MWSQCRVVGYPLGAQCGKSVKIVCRPEVSLRLTPSAGGDECKGGSCRSHTAVKRSAVRLTFLSPLPSFHPQLSHVFPHVLPPPPGAALQSLHQRPHINTHLPDKRSTLSMFSRQILSLPLAVSQPSDLSVCLRTSPRLKRMPSVLGKLQAERSGSRDLEGIGKTQLNGRSCFCLTLPT